MNDKKYRIDLTAKEHMEMIFLCEESLSDNVLKTGVANDKKNIARKPFINHTLSILITRGVGND